MENKNTTVKLNYLTKLVQSNIINLLRDFSNNGTIAKAKAIFSNCPIVLENIDKEKNEFSKSTLVGGYATEEKIVVSSHDIQSVDLNIERELDEILGTIIHEYSHKFRQVDSKYGNMFEEASASIFAEMCINYSKVKNMDSSNTLFNMLTSVDYQKAESQVRGILYVLKQKNMDISMMIEYILGDENKFKLICTQIFGNSFDDYFNKANNISREQQYMNISEDLIVQILTDYIKNNQISLKDYWAENKNIASPTNLYFSGSSVLVQSVVNAGINNMYEDEKNLYKNFEYESKINNEQSQFINDEKRNRIRTKINHDIKISGKSKDEVYDMLVDLCSDYIQHKSKDDEESKIYLDEINKVIPNIQQFSDNFRKLRVMRKEREILMDMDLCNISYASIFSKMDELIRNNEFNETHEIAEQREKLQKQKYLLSTNYNMFNEMEISQIKK